MSTTHFGRTLLSLAWLTILGLFIVEPALAQSLRAGTGEVIALRELQLKSDVDPAEFERFVRETYDPGWEAAVPGVKGYIAKADREPGRGATSRSSSSTASRRGIRSRRRRAVACPKRFNRSSRSPFASIRSSTGTWSPAGARSTPTTSSYAEQMSG